MGIGGTPEGIITACAMKCMGGEIQGKLYPTNDEEIRKAQDAGLDLDTVLTTNDLVSSDNCYFVATGVTNGDMLRHGSFHRIRAPAGQAAGILCGGLQPQELAMRSEECAECETRHTPRG